jgi:hypothetical protein
MIAPTIVTANNAAQTSTNVPARAETARMNSAIALMSTNIHEWR